ncbi:MetQ/NlpA family ABC transporter substrate-binding protein [Klugiella xanthotipulae]|uniref:D-methionine transport system substrate-binding protein n=1 Tax=Klugiella xanthotipulae TaxID=244735 RepID=A0A543HS28_9MICO|nr:MetQ/NlpA family ABC transporter substrate-binding protein [Klugiella xanthotipulae]TQM61146.1 D-methionine transport system substrate-binding protein [Klugiella xanthotipulae]
MSDTASAGDKLIPAPPAKKKTGFIVGAIIAVVVIVAAILIVINLGGNKETVRLGVVGASDSQWKIFIEEAAKEGIDVEVVDFQEYTQPNPAVSEGEIDLNMFQHIIYLAQYNVDSDDDLTIIGSSAIYPLGLYSTKYDDVKDIPEGGVVSVPDDPSNQARALLVLQAADVISLKNGGSPFSTLADVETDKSRVTVKALGAAFTATSLPDVDAAIINNDYVEDAGLTADDVIFQDDPEDESALPYINIFVTRAEDKDNETYRKLVDIYQTSQPVLDAVQKNAGGTAVFVQTPVDQLNKSLAQTEKDYAASK